MQVVSNHYARIFQMPKHKSIIKIIDLFEKRFAFEAHKDIKNKPLVYTLGIFTELGSSLVLITIFVVLGFLSGIKLIYTIIPIYLFQLAIVETIKYFFRRPRPKTNHTKSIFGVKATSGSFPSGHSSNIFAAAYLLSNYYALEIQYVAVLFAIAGAVSFSRIVLGKHYFLDVLGGTILGMILAISGSIIWILTALSLIY